MTSLSSDDPIRPDPDDLPLLEISTRASGVFKRIGEIWDYRELAVSLTRRELKVKYKNSVLGFLWTLLNPLLYLVVFTLVFTGFLKSEVEQYGIFLLSGLLAWNLFATGLTGATTSIVGNGPLVQKVWFPREILPLSAVFAAFINFCFQLIVLGLGLLVFGRTPNWELLPLVIPALGVTMLYAIALGLLLSAANVYLRDIQHFLELGLLAWFWLTPIVYQYDFIAENLINRYGTDRLAMINPMIAVVTTLQAAIYNPASITDPAKAEVFDQLDKPFMWFLTNLAMVGVVGLVLLAIAVSVFGRLEANLGEEL